MPRFFLHLSYDGTKYRGWQIQKQVVSIQQVLCDALSRILHQRIHVQGCGRTDAGVHASQYFGHFDVAQNLPDNFIFIANKVLPDDIVVYEAIPVGDSANAQLHAVSREYTYVIIEDLDPFMRDRAWHVPDHQRLDLDAMRAGLNATAEATDFRAMCRQPDIYPHTRCDIRKVSIFTDVPRQLTIQIEADRFLKAMIRLTVKRIVDIGLGKLSLERYKQHLQSGEPYQPMAPAPPQGLYLSRVRYRNLDRSPIIKIR